MIADGNVDRTEDMAFRPAAKESLACRQPDLVIMEYPSVETIERLAPSMNLAWPSFEVFFCSPIVFPGSSSGQAAK